MAATGTPTPNIGLRIPQGTDPASVDDINYNSNLLDTKLGTVGDTSVQDQIDSLNSKLATDDIGSVSSLSSLESALTTVGTSLQNNQVKYIKFTVSVAFGVFANTIYMGAIQKYQSDRYSVQVQSAYDGYEITGNYKSSSWTWDSLSSNLVTKTTTIADTSPINITSKTSNVVTTANFVSALCPGTANVICLPYVSSGYLYCKLVDNNLQPVTSSVTLVVYYKGS